jgi:F-type H+-transporting ATPase subunit delta
MRDRNVAVRYAQALLDVAVARNLVDPLQESFDGLLKATADHPELRIFMQSPQVPTQDKKALIHKVLDGQVEPVLVQFLELLLDKDRILHLADIHREFVALVERHRGFRRAVVVTAVALREDQAAELDRRLSTLTGSKIILEKKVDPSVIGGVCVTLGDQILDGTLRTGLDRLKQTLEKTPLR